MDEPQNPRPRGARRIGDLAVEAGAAAWRKFGFTEQKILTQWPEIAGGALGALTQPLRLSFPRGAKSGGTLTLLTEGAAALEVQHLAPRLIERINGVFGYPAVEKLKLVQGPLQRPPLPARAAEPSRAEIEAVAATLPPIEDDRLRTALARLGAAIKRQQGAP